MDFLRHSGREHDGLMFLWQQFGNTEDIVRESHVQHTVSLIKHKERQTTQVEVSHANVAEQTARGGNDDIGTHLQSLRLHVKTTAVVAAIDSDAAYAVKIVAKALHGLVYLLCQLTGGGHHDTVDGILGITAVVKQREYRQQIGSSLACAGLCNADEVVAVQNLRNASFLYRCHLLEVHII